READLQTRSEALQAREAKARRDDAVAFAAQLVSDGKALPREQAAIVELLLALPVDTSLSFAEGDGEVTRPAAEALRNLLAGRPKLIEFAEKAREEVAAQTVSFAAPDGLAVDSGRAGLHARAVAYRAEHPDVSYLD